MFNLKSYIIGAAAFACIAAIASSAQAQSYAFGAGTSVPSVAYRRLFDCWYNQAQGSSGKPGPFPKARLCPHFNISAAGGLILYAPTTSSNGKTVLRTNDKAQIGVPAASNIVPFTDFTIGVNNTTDYDGVQFIGSDDVITTADVATWNAAGNPSTFGNIIQLPTAVSLVAIGFNGNDGEGKPLNIIPPTPAGGTSGLNLSRRALCGIVSGHITKWNNAILTDLNGGVVLGHGNITFVHRSDGAAATFLLSNALATQCQFEFGPNNEIDPTMVSYAFPWTDRAAAACPFPVARGANLLNWPDQFFTDQCNPSLPISNPGGGGFASASGSVNLVNLVASINGAIGYAPVDFWLPITPGSRPTANIQSQWDVTAATGQFQPPTLVGAQTTMASAVLQFTPASRANPLAWSLQGLVPNPVVPGAYPIAGFTWIDMYQCYQVHANGSDALLWFRNFLNFLYGFQIAHNILNDDEDHRLFPNVQDQFIIVPNPWLAEIYTLLNDPANGPTYAGVGGCVGKVGAY